MANERGISAAIATVPCWWSGCGATTGDVPAQRTQRNDHTGGAKDIEVGYAGAPSPGGKRSRTGTPVASRYSDISMSHPRL